MAEVPEGPGEYDNPSTMNTEVIEVLKQNCWDSYVNTEFGGQAACQNLPRDQLVDEVQQVRRHQDMLKRLIGA